MDYLFKKLEQLIISLLIKTKIHKMRYGWIIKLLKCSFVLSFMVSVFFIWLASFKSG